MDMSENVIEQLDYTLCTYPFDLPIEYEKYIEDAFIKKKECLTSLKISIT